MSCERALPLLYDLIDGDIERDDAVWLAEHLAACAGCAALLRELRAADAVYSRQIPVDTPPALAARIMDAAWSEAGVKSRLRSWEPAAAALLLVSLIGMLFLPGGFGEEAGPLTRAVGGLPRFSLDVVLDLRAVISSAAHAVASRLPVLPAGVAGMPLAAAAVALQIIGSAWLLRPRRAVPGNAR
jgi:hypothetical protein